MPLLAKAAGLYDIPNIAKTPIQLNMSTNTDAFNVYLVQCKQVIDYAWH